METSILVGRIRWGVYRRFHLPLGGGEMTNTEDGCARCGKSGVPLYENAAKPGQLLCFACLDQENARQVDRYPGWREREQRHEQRAQVARRNFALTALILFMLLATGGKAADTPNYSKELNALTVTLVGAAVLDVESTHRWEVSDRAFRERNPLLPRRPSRPLMYAGGGATVLGVHWLARRWYRSGHKWRARALLVGAIAVEVYCDQGNLRMGKKHR